MTNLGKELRARVADAAEVRSLAVDAEQVSKDGTRKLRLRTDDGRMIETVLIPDGDAAAPDDDLDEDDGGGRRPSRSICSTRCFPSAPSSRSACRRRSAARSTAASARRRSSASAGSSPPARSSTRSIARRTSSPALDADDPTRRAGSDRVTNLVFMGMGEPLHNYKNLVRALDILTDGGGADFSRRRITVSTAGLVPGIEKLAAETQSALRVNLAVSLNATTDRSATCSCRSTRSGTSRACSRRCARSRSRSGGA